MDVDPIQLLRDWPAILITWLAMLISRGAFVGAVLPQIARLEGGLPEGFGKVVFWGGIRGSIAMVLALSIPRSFEERQLAVNCIFGASLLTILIQSTTIGALLKRLGLIQDRKAFEIVERLRGRLRSQQAAVGYLERQHELGVVTPPVYQEVRRELEAEQKKLEAERAEAREMASAVKREEVAALRRKLLLVRKESLRQASVDGAIDEQVMRSLVGELDEDLHQMDAEHHKVHVEQEEEE